MRMVRRSWFASLVIAALVSLGSNGCSSSSAPAACTSANSGACPSNVPTAYSCTGGATPAPVNCIDQTTGAGGARIYCCPDPNQNAAPPPTCTTDPASTTCNGSGATAYVCQPGAALADTVESAANCIAGAENTDGSTPYCCIPGCSKSYSTECNADGYTYFQCQGQASPIGDQDMACGSGLAQSNGATDYCCSPRAACNPINAVGCMAPSTFYACPGNNTPAAAPGSTCAPWGPYGTGAGYCCTPGSCAPAIVPADVSATACYGRMVYVCGDASPAASDPSMFCTDIQTASADATHHYYCCGTASCTGGNNSLNCPSLTYPFLCTGSATPAASMNCTGPSSAGPGDTIDNLYCCKNAQ